MRCFLISIILSTHNGANRLSDLFDSFCDQNDLSLINFEFIAVDNGSNDETCNIIKGYCIRFPWLKYVKEGNLGINYARNRGILEAKGDVVIFVDDDISFSKEWLSAYQELFDSKPDALVAGGRVSCILPDGVMVPSWLQLKGDYSFPYITFSVEYGEIVDLIAFGSGLMPVGPNMAFRREVFNEFGLFRTDLGLKGKSLMPGAEYEYFSRLQYKILQWYYVPGAHVFHPIKTSQLSRDYFLKRTFGVGRVAAKTMILPSTVRRIGLLPVFCIRMLFENILRYIKSLGSFNARKIFYCKAQIYKIAGIIYEFVFPRKS